MPQAMEITTFQLAAGLTLEDFIAANADIDPWLQTQPGFVSRRIAQRDDGTIVDMLLWRHAEDGHRAAIGITTEMSASPVHAAIDQSSVDWSIANVSHVVEVVRPVKVVATR